MELLVNISLIFILILSPFVFTHADVKPRKLRQYKICKAGECNSLTSFPSSEYMNRLLFSFSGWNNWSKCNKDCTTYRSRVCRFPFLCGTTVVHEEAFCFHRGTMCEYQYLKYMRELEPTSNNNAFSDYRLDYDSEYVDESIIREKNEEEQGSTASSEIAYDEDDPFQNFKYPRTNDEISSRQNMYQNPVNSIRTVHDENTSENSLDESGGNDLSKQETCGVARITERNRRGISMRILGGKETRKGRWPWQVAILNKFGETFCGGTLISSRWIVTAAHCVRRRIQVTIGEHHLHKVEGTEKHYKIETAFIHPNFDPETVDNDIALLLLPETVGTKAGVACLPGKYQPMPATGTMCTILGWGKEKYDHVFGTSSLHEGKVPLVSNADCSQMYDTAELTRNMFCSGFRNGTVDSCAGDSGGPLLCRQNNRWAIFGVTSFGDGCGRVGKYGIYAKVPNYVSWINKVITATEQSRQF